MEIFKVLRVNLCSFLRRLAKNENKINIVFVTRKTIPSLNLKLGAKVLTYRS